MSIYREVESFYKAYQGEKCIIGKTILNRNIYAMFIGKHCAPIGLVQGAMHAREWITAYLILEQIKLGVCNGGAWMIPLSNPDGVILSTEGINQIESRSLRKKLLYINGNNDFSLWKANSNCVDLNVNFDADWGKGACNVTIPSFANYIGPSPFSENETKSLRDFTQAISPQYTISYHTQGEEIYWYYDQNLLLAARDKRLATILSKSTGYSLKIPVDSAGGYKDWCIQKLKISSFTIETGNGKHPLQYDSLKEILAHNLCSVYDLSKNYYRSKNY